MSRRTFKIYFAICIALVPVACVIEAGVWNECRGEGHSFFYCMNLISGK